MSRHKKMCYCGCDAIVQGDIIQFLDIMITNYPTRLSTDQRLVEGRKYAWMDLQGRQVKSRYKA